MRLRPVIVVAAGVVAAVIVWFLLDRTNDEPETAATTTAAQTTPVAPSLGGPIVQPKIATEADLRALAARFPFYWLGSRDGTRLELTSTGDGTVYVRYLPSGTAAGSTRAALTIATYPRPDAFAEVTRAASKDGAAKVELPDGAIAVAGPNNVHLAFPDSGQQIEVFSPRPGLARKLVTAGAVEQVEGA
jgi:hypothetical protein